MRLRWLAIFIHLLCVPAAHAQFKWVDQDGRIGYGDKPPPGARHIESLGGVSRGTQPDQATHLPYQLQRTVRDFPVTLYTTNGCDACDSARSLLKARAVPFAERTIVSADDVEALKKLAGTDRLPVFQVGSRLITGFNSATWDDALDLAGYPRGASLPADWVWAAPTPLTQAKPPQPAPAEPDHSKQE
jgi:glutaredoxin